MGIGDWLQDALDGTSNAANTLDRYINPFHREVKWEGGKATGDPENDAPLGKYVAEPIGNSLEAAMHGLSWVYDNAISQPITTFMLVAPRTGDDPSEWGEMFQGETWSRAWHVAEHVSPGQAMWANHQETDAILENRLLYAKPEAAYLPPGFDELSEDEQQRWLREAGMPAIGNRAVEQMRRDHAWFTFASGATDFAFRWWLDPAVLGGKGLGAARQKYIVQSRPKGGWDKADLDSIMSSSKMGKAQDFLWANKDNPALINNLNMFRKSALGPRAGGIISSLKDPDEVGLFLRTSLGDVEARVTLETRNAEAAWHMQQDTARIAKHELSLERLQSQGNTRIAAVVEARIQQLKQQVNAHQDVVDRYEAALAHWGELDAVNLTRWSTTFAQRRTRAQADFRTGPALGTAGTPRGALGKARLYARDFYGPNIVVVRSFEEAHPNGLVAIDDIHPESVAELRGHLARIPAIGADIRQSYLNQYLKTTTEGERIALLEEIQAFAVRQVAEKHGFTDKEAMALYREYQARIIGGQDRLRRYSAGAFPGEKVHLDEFLDSGGILSVHPNMVTKLANDHILIDLQALDKTLARHGSALKALRTASIGNRDWIVNGADYFTQLWKFGTLFRLGYIPRVLGDDLAGQVARLGAASMALRAGWGVKNLATNLAHWRPAKHYEAQEAVAREGIKFIDSELKPLIQELAYHRRDIALRQGVAQRDAVRARDRHRRAFNALNALPPNAPARTLRARQALVAKRAADVQRAERFLANVGSGKAGLVSRLDDQITELQAQRAAQASAADGLKEAAQRGFRQSSQLHREVTAGRGVVVPAAFVGERGEYFKKMTSSDDSLRTLLARNKQIIHGNLQRAYGKQGVAISYPQDPKKFVSSWHQAINQQLMQDALAQMAIKGASVQEMTHWLTRTPHGRAYHKRLGIKYSTPDRIAASVRHEVDEYLPTPEIRMAALEGKADLEFLENAAKAGQHPMDVHTTQLGETLGGPLTRSMDRVMDWFYRWAAAQPADRMSRHPLFNQLYEGHAKTLVAQEVKQGARVTQKDADRIAATARRLALKDTRKLVFDIAHRSDAAHALRFISPFFAATTEAWQRWARIIADRPQTVGYASMIFNAPISMGWMQDADGNRIHRDGTVLVQDENGKTVKKLVPKGQRYIMARVPKFLVGSDIGRQFHLDNSGTWLISQDSLHIVTQGDPWFNPGVGPIVSIPVNEFVKDKPSQGELARHLGILPHGPTAGSPLFGNTPLGRAADLSMPQTVKNFLTAYDTTDERYQRVKLHIMQRAAYDHAERGKPMPSAKEISEMTRSYWLQSAFWAFSQPAATQRTDAYAFYRDQYNNLRRQDPNTADQEFIERFGESYFIFAQAQSENVVGAQATKKAVELSKKYEGLLAEHPELGALIIGPEGNGPFSPEAYTYQLTHPLVPGGAEMQRRKLSAEGAMKENQRRLGWARFTQLQNWVTSQLHAKGLKSFSDAGAEQLKATKAAIARLLGEPTLPDGSANPYYNEEWSRDYYSLDPRRYERMIPGLTEIAYSDMARSPNRSDLRSLQTYLTARKTLTQELERRAAAGGSRSLGAKKNADLAAAWARIVDGLIEADTRFGDLHHRYLSRDMGVDVDELADLLQDAEEVA